MKRLFIIIALALVVGGGSAQNIKFGIITDLHHDIMPDAPERLDAFLKAARKAKVDFVIDLGDFAMVKPENDAIVEQWQNSGIEHYSVLGNHDMDNCTKQEYIKYIGMPSRYYSFEKEGVLFIVLDANNIYRDGKYTPYANANFYIDSEQRAWIDPEQMEWLSEQVKRNFKTVVIFSHQSLENTVNNGTEVQAILEA